MPSKDYYVLLNVQPQASQEEIKLAYRRLALKYHPDRNAGNVHTEALFKEINEAYTVLSNQQKRDAYNRLRNDQNTTASQPQKTTRQKPVVTGRTVLFQCTHLRSLIEKSNPFAVNTDALLAKLEEILSDAHLHILLYENKPQQNAQVLHEILFCCKPLPLNYFYKINSRLYKLAGNNAIMRNSIQQFIKQKKQEQLWQKYKFFWVLLITIIICFLIYFM